MITKRGIALPRIPDWAKQKGKTIAREYFPQTGKHMPFRALDDPMWYRNKFERLLQGLTKKAFHIGFLKTAGGPGSGVAGNNTDTIDFMEHSPLISIGKRKEFLEGSRPIETKDIEIAKIRFKGQHKYVPEKLMAMIMSDVRGDGSLWEKPIKVLKDSNDEYHVIDGHHRFLAALIRGRPTIKSEVYSSDKLEKSAALDMEKRYANMKKQQINRRALGLEPPIGGMPNEREEIEAKVGNPYENSNTVF